MCVCVCVLCFCDDIVKEILDLNLRNIPTASSCIHQRMCELVILWRAVLASSCLYAILRRQEISNVSGARYTALWTSSSLFVHCGGGGAPHRMQTTTTTFICAQSSLMVCDVAH